MMNQKSTIIAALLVSCFLLTMIPSTNMSMIEKDRESSETHVFEPISSPEICAGPYEVHRNWTINIVFVGYDSDIVNETRFMLQMPTQRTFPHNNLTYYWNIDYDVVWANSSYESALKTFMYTMSVNGTGTGTVVNETALSDMRADGIARDCFDSRDGRAINGTAVEEWLVENPAVLTPSLGWTFYLLNYSELDNLDHSLEHWFDYNPFDPDSGEKMDWFRLEWDNELNPDIKYQYAGVGGLDRVYILDASADQWYTKWADIWRTPAAGPHCLYDLDTYVEDLDLQTIADQENLTDYLSGYSYSIVSNLFVPTIHSYTDYMEKVSLRVMAFAMDDITNESISWIQDEVLIHDALEEALPWVEWEIQVDFLHIDDYLDWNYTFWSNASIINGETIVDGLLMFYDIYYGPRYDYWLDDGYDLPMFSAIFVKDDMVMQYAGQNYTALGGSGQTVIWKANERYYRPDGITPKAGISSVQIHELGHALGLGHTFSGNRYEADFHYGVMGYFGRHEKFSSFEYMWMRASFLDTYRDAIYKEFLDGVQSIPEPWQSKTLEAKQYAEEEFANEIDLYNQGDWMGAYEALAKAENWTARMLHSLNEDVAPVIHDWDIQPSESQTGDSLYIYANVSDADSLMGEVQAIFQLNDLSNITVELQWNGTCYDGYFTWPSSSSLDVYIFARDQAMNNQTSDTRYLTDTISPMINHPDDIEYIYGTTGNSILWNPTDPSPSSYTLYIDDVPNSPVGWDGSSIPIDVDGLSVGSYNYTIEVFDESSNSIVDTVIVTVVPETIAPNIDSPEDLTYTEGETGSSIVWTPSDDNPDSYEIHKNGTLVKYGSWNSTSETITIVVDGLEAGVYNYTITVFDIFGNSEIDTVFVIVEEVTTTSTTTTTTDTTTTDTNTTPTTTPTLPEWLNENMVLVIGIGALVIIVIICVTRRR